MFRLNELAPLTKKRKRIGRGGSRGGTSGRGHKGQKARSGGKIRIGFEGGQMPLYRRLPKRGFNNSAFQDVIKIINIGDLNGIQEQEITKELLVSKGIIKAPKDKPFTLKVLGMGNVDRPFTVITDTCSMTARKAIEQAGGKVVTKKG
jgi:large subunit ribosomal protein L15